MTGNILALIAATMVLVLIPGPNVALIVATSLQRGFRSGFLTVLGTTTGVAIQLALVVAGMAAAIEYAATTLYWMKWLGVAYLLYLGVRTWREPSGGLENGAGNAEYRTFWRGTLIAVVNPKTLLFNAAFLPQFVSGGAGAAAQLLLVAAVYTAVVLAGDTLWALFASSARGWLGKVGRVRNRITGFFLVGAGALLARHNA